MSIKPDPKARVTMRVTDADTLATRKQQANRFHQTLIGLREKTPEDLAAEELERADAAWQHKHDRQTCESNR